MPSYCLLDRLGDMEVEVSNQNQIFAGKKFANGKLLLLPLGSLSVVAVDKTVKTQCCITSTELSGQVYVLQPWRCDFQKKLCLFIPYFYGKEAPSIEEARLEVHGED